MLPDQDSNLD